MIHRIHDDQGVQLAEQVSDWHANLFWRYYCEHHHNIDQHTIFNFFLDQSSQGWPIYRIKELFDVELKEILLAIAWSHILLRLITTLVGTETFSARKRLVYKGPIKDRQYNPVDSMLNYNVPKRRGVDSPFFWLVHWKTYVW